MAAVAYRHGVIAHARIEGRLFTTGPYDLFFMINGQIDICLEKFRLRNKVFICICTHMYHCYYEQSNTISIISHQM
jgi:hypothetical protein